MLSVIPTRRTTAIFALAAGVMLLALIAGVPIELATWVTIAFFTVMLGALAADFLMTRRAWRTFPPRLTRRLPEAFAIAVRRDVHLSIESGDRGWDLLLIEGTAPTVEVLSMPMAVALAPQQRVDSVYAVIPTARGDIAFAPAEVRVKSAWGLCELNERLGTRETRRVYPDFSQIARYAWLAGDRRLQEMGIKTYPLRGQGTDFKQLSDYRPGDSVRYIDWRATSRLAKPIVREFQDERDQCVMFLVDCGRRLRSEDRQTVAGTTHFDQVLNAVMLLAYVALAQGDAVGAMTFGTTERQQRFFPAQKGRLALNALMGQLYDVEPTATHSDFLSAAQDLLVRQRKRALVIVVTNFRDEDSSELAQALTLLRSRHLVLLASLRERIVRELMMQPLTSGSAVVDVASAHLYEQSRRDAFNRLAARDALMVDAEPQLLGVQLVNRYHAVKRAGLI